MIPSKENTLSYIKYEDYLIYFRDNFFKQLQLWCKRFNSITGANISWTRVNNKNHLMPHNLQDGVYEELQYLGYKTIVYTECRMLVTLPITNISYGDTRHREVFNINVSNNTNITDRLIINLKSMTEEKYIDYIDEQINTCFSLFDEIALNRGKSYEHDKVNDHLQKFFKYLESYDIGIKLHALGL